MDGYDQLMSSSKDKAPSRFGSYEVIQLPGGARHELGRGGFGSTYRARHTFLGTEVALKVIADRLIFDEPAKARFLKEAREHARLDHPGIARITDFGEMGGSLYYVMELCQDGDLKEYVRKKGPLPAVEAMHFILQTAEALRYVHECGILHRDIKPSNLLVVLKGGGPPKVKITDFGLVKSIAHEEHPAGEQEAGSSWSPAFASPEQIREEALDERTDIFSLGMTAWFLIMGEIPMDASVQEIVDERISPADYTPRLPRELTGKLRAVVARMVEKDPARRYRSCAELVEDLRPALQRDGQDAGQTTRRALEPLAAQFTLGPGQKVFAGEVFHGTDLRREVPVRVTLWHSRHPAALVEQTREKVRRLAATQPPGLVPILEMSRFTEGWAVMEQEISGVTVAAALRREGAVPLRAVAGLLWDAATGLDAAAECGVTPAPLETALLEGVPESGAVDWSAARIRISLQFVAPPPDWDSGADLTAVPALASPLKMFAGLVYQALSARQVRSAALHSSAACPPIPALGSEGNRILATCLAGEARAADCRRLLLSLLSSENMPAEGVERRALERRLKMLGEAVDHETRRIETAPEHQTTTNRAAKRAAEVKAGLEQQHGEATEEAYLEALAEIRTLAEQVESSMESEPPEPLVPLSPEECGEIQRRIAEAARQAREWSGQAWRAKPPSGSDDQALSSRQLEAHRSAKEAAALEREAGELAAAGRLDSAAAERLLEAAETAAARAREAASACLQAEEPPPDATVVHALQAAERTRDGVVYQLVPAGGEKAAGQKKPGALLVVLVLLILAAAGGGGYWWYLQRETRVVSPQSTDVPVSPVRGEAALPATIRLRSFQSLYPLPPALTIGGKTGTLDGTTLVFKNAAAADGTFRPDSPAWQLTGRPVALEENDYEAKLKLVTVNVPVTGKENAHAWASVLLTPNKPEELPDMDSLRALFGATGEDTKSLKFPLDADTLHPLTLPPGTYHLAWEPRPSPGGSPKPVDGGAFTVTAGETQALAIPLAELERKPEGDNP